MSKRKDGNWMLKWENKIRVRLSALDKKKLVLTIILMSLQHCMPIGHRICIGAVPEKT